MGYKQITCINREWEEQKSPGCVGIEERAEPMSKLVNEFTKFIKNCAGEDLPKGLISNDEGELT